MVLFGGETSDGVGFCGVFIVFLTVVLNFFNPLGGGTECVLARSLSEVSMVTPSECCAGVCSKGGVGSVDILPGVFARMMRWCVSGSIRIWVGAVGVDEVWFVAVGVGVMFSAVVPICLIVFVINLHGILAMFVFLFLSSLLHGSLLLLLMLLCPSVFQLALCNGWVKRLSVQMFGIRL